MEVDPAEPWVTTIDAPRYRVSLPLHWMHEGGHAIGLLHGPPGSIMQATFDPSIKHPQQWDIAEARQRYGAAAVVPTEPTDPDDPAEFVAIPSFKIPKGWIL
jgi:hypothetical protein